MACEKTVKVLCVPSTLLRRVGRDEVQGRGEGGWIGMDELGGGVRGGVRKGKQKKGNGGLSRCEMTLLEHGFKKLNKVPILGALDSTLGTDSGDKSSAPKVYAVLLQLFETYSISVLSRTRSVMSQTPRWRALRWISISVKVCI